MTDQIDLNILIVGRSQADALRALIAMDFGCQRFNPADFGLAHTYLSDDPFSVNWQGSLSSEARRLEFLFRSELFEESPDIEESRPAEFAVVQTPAPRPGANAVQALSLEPSNSLIRAHSPVMGSFMLSPMKLADVVAPQSDDPLPNRGFGGFKNTVRRLFPTSSNSDTKPLHRQTLRICFHLDRYNQSNSPMDAFERTLMDTGQDVSKGVKMAVIFVTEQAPTRKLAIGNTALAEDIRSVLFAVNAFEHRQAEPVPFVLAAGELAIPIASVPNSTTWRDLYDLKSVEDRYGLRINDDVFLDPLGHVYSPDYIEKFTDSFLQYDVLSNVIRGAKLKGFAFRTVPFDVNGVDTANQCLASVCLPFEQLTNENFNRGKEFVVGPVFSTLFDQVARDLYKVSFPTDDFWNNMLSNWKPIRTSTILAAAITQVIQESEAGTDTKHRFWL